MSLAASCVRCSGPVLEAPDDPEGRWACPQHGLTHALWHAPEATYDAFAEHLAVSRSFPSYLPWPLSPGWSVTDFAAVGDAPGRARATLTCVTGTSELDGTIMCPFRAKNWRKLDRISLTPLIYAYRLNRMPPDFAF